MNDFKVYRDGDGVLIKAWNTGIDIEEEAFGQLYNVASLPFIFRHVAAMPDCHMGMGATIGSVIPTQGAIIPAAVGVDIGCGMAAMRLTNVWRDNLPDLKALRDGIENAVPHGRTDNGGKNDRGAWGTVPTDVERIYHTLYWERLNDLRLKYPTIQNAFERAPHQLGTLGTGNHFVEVSIDEEDRVWIVVHSGSRGIGNKLGSMFTKLAKEACAQWFVDLPDPNLAYIPEGTDLFGDYIMAMGVALDYAKRNRRIMLTNALRALTNLIGDVNVEPIIDCHHNFAAREAHFGKNVWVTRKGATRARKDDLIIIPGSMGTRSYICEGLGNANSFHSCSHGAGRAMSRTKARKTFTIEDHIAATAGVECIKDESVLDETPGAYKDIDAVMVAQDNLVKPIHTLKQVICVKG